MRILLTIDLAGVAIGLIGLALVWPLGPIAFLVVTAVLLVTAAILWPLPVLAGAAALGAAAWLML